MRARSRYAFFYRNKPPVVLHVVYLRQACASLHKHGRKLNPGHRGLTLDTGVCMYLLHKDVSTPGYAYATVSCGTLSTNDVAKP